MELWIILSLFSALLYSLSEILGKEYLSKKDFDSSELLTFSYLFYFIILLILFFKYIEFNKLIENPLLFLGKGISLSFFSIFYFNLLKKYEISIVSPLLNLSPLVLVGFSSIFLLEEISKIQLIGIIIIIFSTYFLETTHSYKFKRNPLKNHIKDFLRKPSVFFLNSFFLLITISFTAVFDRMILTSGVGIFTNLFFTSLIMLIFFLIYFNKNNHFFKKKLTNKRLFDLSIYSGVRLIDTLFILFIISMPLISLSIVISLRRTSTFFSSLIGGLIFHETHLLKKLFSIFIMLIGVVLLI